MLTIKAASSLTGLTPKAIRHYEAMGLIKPSDRTDAGYRLYSDDDVFRLRKIQYFRELKFSLQEVSELLDASQEQQHEAMRRQRRVVDQKMEEYRRAQAIMDAVLTQDEPPAMPDYRSRLAVVTIDMQNDILEGGALACKRILNILPPLRKLFAQARELGVPLIYVCDRHFRGDPELLIWNDHMMAGTWGAQIIDEVSPMPGDHIVYKNRFNGFVDTELDDVLKKLNVKNLLMTGWRTHVCVAQTAIEAFYRGYTVSIAADGIDSTTASEHEHGLSLMQINYGFETYSCENALEELLSRS